MLGVLLRFVNLEGKVYWHDEAFTSLRAGGFTVAEIVGELFQNRFVPATQLQQFQQLKPESTIADTVRSLAVEDAQHPPLYFLLARKWMGMFGESRVASRSLAVLLSLLALPWMYGLGLELFGSGDVALLATTLLALSPLDLLFAQMARQYSLLAAIALASQVLFLRSLRQSTWRSWGFYGLICTLGWYTQPLFGLAVMAQGVYLALLSLKRQFCPRFDNWEPWIDWRVWRQYLAAIAVSVLLYSPWLWVQMENFQYMAATTAWARERVGLLFLAKSGMLNFTALFLDLGFGFDHLWTYLLRLPILVAIAAALYTLCHRAPRFSGWFILTTIVVPLLLLLLADLIGGGRQSTVPRYLIPCFPGIQLGVAYWLARGLFPGRQPRKQSVPWWRRKSVRFCEHNPVRSLLQQYFWPSVLVLLLGSSLFSCTLSAWADTWWNKHPSYFNGAIAQRLNATANPLLLSDIGDDYTNPGNLLSLSYQLDDKVNLLLLAQPPDLSLLVEQLGGQLENNANAFVFHPSSLLRDALQQYWQLEPELAAADLWRVKG